MKIVNPLYDSGFKYMMDNEEIAKIVLSIILGQKVCTLQIKSFETPIFESSNGFVSRYDFKALICDSTGEYKDVLIEVQKYKTPNPIARFRNYLAQNYMREETFTNTSGDSETKMLPIIAIYILGFDLPEYDVPVIKLENVPYDVINNRYIKDVKSETAELLTHTSYFLIAIPKPNYKSRGTRLEIFLNVFNQKLRGDASNIVYEINEQELGKDEDIDKIFKYLNLATLNEKLVRSLKYEEEYQKGMKDLEKEVKEERRQKEEAKQREEEAKFKLAKKMKKYDEPLDEIIKETGLTKEIIDNL